jgi:hypothetical protein
MAEQRIGATQVAADFFRELRGQGLDIALQRFIHAPATPRQFQRAHRNQSGRARRQRT